ncbi:MAG: type I DNA topoisomerase [Ignavibacteria bacterium]
MAKYVVLVESPSKAKTIKKYLGKDYIVEATVGHIKDLPKSSLGVDFENGFKPKIISIKGKTDILKKIKSLAKESEKIFIATDPDREGEAIAQDIYESIKNGDKEVYRVLFHEITEKGVKEGMQNPRSIDYNLVASQRARRVMDRIIGYKISPILWNTLHLIESSGDSALSAGRVQSVALRLICEREEEIQNFVPLEYWSIVGIFQTESGAKLLSKLFSFEGKTYKIPEEKFQDEEAKKEFFEKYFYIPDEQSASELIEKCKNENFKITRIEKKIVNRNPAPPFTTSTLQQEASRKLYFRPRQTMQYAQKLYEGVELGKDEIVGLITYMRTDSVRVSEEAIASAREFIAKTYGNDYLPESPRIYQSKKQNVQDAHEAIRPTNLKYTPEYVKKYLPKELYKLYELIWNRFIASQMKPAQFEQVSLDITGGDFVFRSTGSTMLFKGYLAVYDENGEENQIDEDINENENRIPQGLAEGQLMNVIELKKNQHFTKPPARYTESSLVKELDNLGIGRPSTYASIISTLYDREYVVQEDRKLIPTELGKKVNQLLVQNFDHIFNVNFTAQMEEELDEIAEGTNKYENVLTDFYVPFKNILDEVEKKIEKPKCDLCGADMEIKVGRFGRFLACTNYPTCKNVKSLKDFSKDDKSETLEQLDEKCPKCGNPLVYRNSRYGKFIGCSKYPDCDYTRPITLGIKCPKCKEGEITPRFTKKRRIFYGCSRYPDCDYVSWNKPTDKICPNCNNDLLVIVKTGKKEKLKCNSCDYTEELENSN